MSETDPTDLALAARAAADAGAFAELYRRYVRRVYAYHVARTGDPALAEDLTSQTFIAALDGIHAYRAEGSFAAWLLTIAHRKMVDHYRRRRPDQTLDEAGDYPEPGPTPEERADHRTRLRRIRLALQSLAAERAEALRLRFFSGLSLREVAGVMGKGEPAVKMLIHRGLQDLRQRLSVEMLEEE